MKVYSRNPSTKQTKTMVKDYLGKCRILLEKMYVLKARHDIEKNR
jgi:hypothetical protein